MYSKSYKHNFKHSLGQNFLCDEFVLDDIAHMSGIDSTNFVLEIGSGNGALTRCLCDLSKHVVTMEIDKSLIPLLKDNMKDYKNVSIICADFMKYDFCNIMAEFEKYSYDKNNMHIKVVANLPYYITSPIIQKLLLIPQIDEITIMVQKEVAERIVAIPSTKDYGILTISCNYFSESEILMIVPKEYFFPVPKVDSAVVHLKKHSRFTDLTNLNTNDIEHDNDYISLFTLIRICFQERRKKLVNALLNSKQYDKETIINALNTLGLPENVRAENLSLEDYEKLLLEINKKCI